jgi:hypothetical protein
MYGGSRGVLSLVVATVVGAVFVVVPGVVQTRSAASTLPYAYCPAARHIITSHTRWHQHQLGPGISLAEADVGHHRRRLHINVVRADLRQPRVAVRPLRRALTHRQRLPDLARRKHLVAASNGPYFNLATGSPAVPVIGPRGPLVLTDRATWLAGIGSDGRAEDGTAWLDGTARSATGSQRLAAINWATPVSGLSVYTPAWGSRKVPISAVATTIAVRHRAALGPPGRRRTVPRGGRLLVATRPQAIAWMLGLRRGSRLSVHYRTGTVARSPFREAYGVGTQVVGTPDHVRSGLYCSRSEVYAARTDFAWRAHGRELIIATVGSPRGNEHAGVDENQMSQIMATLGAGRSYALDGGGSTELVARLPGRGLSVRTTRHGRALRRIPIGIGVYSLPKPKSRHRPAPHPKAPRRPKQPTPTPSSPPSLLGGLLGLLLPRSG